MKRKAVVLAAGKSTRLLPLTDHRPKPMLSVGEKPFLSYVIEWLKKNGVTDIFITLHYCPEKIVEYFGDGSNFGVQITYLPEDKLWDTAGSLKKNEKFFEEDFLVVSGSYYLPGLNLADFWRFHQKKGGIGSVVFKFLENLDFIQSLGQGVFDEDGRLVFFQEKPAWLVSHFIHTTYQIYSPRIFRYIPKEVPFSLPGDLIPLLINSGEKIYCFTKTKNTPLICISNRDMYEQAQHSLGAVKNGRAL